MTLRGRASFAPVGTPVRGAPPLPRTLLFPLCAALLGAVAGPVVVPASHLLAQPVPGAAQEIDLQQALTPQQARAMAELRERLAPDLRAQLSARDLASLLPDSGQVELMVGPRLYRFVDGVAVDSQMVRPSVAGAARPQAPQDVAVSVTDSVARPSGSSARAVLGRSGRSEMYTVPYRLMVPVAEEVGTTDGGAGSVALEPVFWTQPERLQWREGERHFQTTLRLALADTTRPDSRRLEQGVVLYLSSDADLLEPDSVVLSETNRPTGVVQVAARAPGDSLHFTVNAFRLRDTDAWIRTRPALLLEGPSRMEGLGVEERTVTVRLMGRSPRPDVPTTVTVTAGRGDVEPTTVEVGSRPSATLRLRSGDVGEDMLEATAPGVQPDSHAVRYAWPVFFLLASLVGGALGGAARRAVGGPPWARSIGYGVVLGLFAAVVYFVLGVKVFAVDVEVPFFNHGAVLALAALAAFYLLKEREEEGGGEEGEPTPEPSASASPAGPGPTG